MLTIDKQTVERWAREFFPHMTLQCGCECVVTLIVHAGYRLRKA